MSRRKRYTRNLGRSLPSPLPRRTTMEWVRFEHERQPYGVFTFIDDAEQGLAPSVRDDLRHLSEWFCKHLQAPSIASLERFWFCAEATEHVTRARQLAELVRSAGIPIVERRTRRIPGKVRYTDDAQIAVVTFRDAPQPRR